MRITLRQLAVFTAVADAGSTSAAGGRVALSQSATSAALNELEAVLEAKLFDRVGTRLVLNDTGRGLLPQARAVLDGAAGIERDFGLSAVAGERVAPSLLRVGASTTIGNYLLPTLVARWQRQRPGAQVDVRIANTGAIAAAVARMEVDVGLIEGPCHEPDVVAQAWREEELAIVCAPSHPLLGAAVDPRLNVAALRQAPWLLREPGSGTREAVEQALQPHLHSTCARGRVSAAPRRSSRPRSRGWASRACRWRRCRIWSRSDGWCACARRCPGSRAVCGSCTIAASSSRRAWPASSTSASRVDAGAVSSPPSR